MTETARLPRSARAVACSLLDRQTAALEEGFVEDGGFTERLYRVRKQRRERA